MGYHEDAFVKEMTDFLDGVMGVVEANSFESLMLWKENKEYPNWTWEQNNSGLMEIVGQLDGRPVCISLYTTVINGHKVLFLHPTSTVVDHDMIGDWMKRTLPETAFRKDGYVNKQDAMNFTNLFNGR